MHGTYIELVTPGLDSRSPLLLLTFSHEAPLGSCLRKRLLGKDSGSGAGISAHACDQMHVVKDSRRDLITRFIG